MRVFNSLLKIKEGQCAHPNCSYIGPLWKGLCASHYQMGLKLKYIAKQDAKEIESEDGLPELIERLDSLISKFVRISAADANGFVLCYTCGDKYHWKEVDAGHYIGRACMHLRFDVDRNIRPQCHTCNRINYGMQLPFAKRLEEDRPGITDILYEESNIPYKWNRFELEQMISDYTKKIKKLKIS